MRISDWSSDVCSSDLTATVSSVALQQSGDASGLELQSQLLLELVNHPRTALLTNRGDHPSHRMCSDRNNEPSPLSPLWIRRVSAFLVKVAGVAVPLLQLCFTQDRKSVVRGKGGSVRLDQG